MLSAKCQAFNQVRGIVVPAKTKVFIENGRTDQGVSLLIQTWKSLPFVLSYQVGSREAQEPASMAIS